ncbi:hypothetical protein POVWA2_091820 [Plasmodium ovale wallikeri]|uniref:Uncharacterized protein n=1 Tax=Plasmodium ovale wallikeri TaxID=864142 RepID=A0A1A9ASB4_PLAOA|nr:hypothetical protein POVWA1_016870 [Plasmodium ovale wallikeri]SBT59113.1 hypothetical protein POVWA2_091820 [Plasmodium ovale wallikeri]
MLNILFFPKIIGLKILTLWMVPNILKPLVLLLHHFLRHKVYMVKSLLLKMNHLKEKNYVLKETLQGMY